MEKAFDAKDLVAKLKDGGLDVAEEAAKHVAKSVFAWASESVVLTPNKYDDLLVGVLPVVEKAVLKEIDKIDGAEG